MFSEDFNLSFVCDILSQAEIRIYLGVQEEVQFFYNVTTSLRHEYFLEVQQIDQTGPEIRFVTKKTVNLNTVCEKPLKNSHNYWPMIIQIVTIHPKTKVRALAITGGQMAVATRGWRAKSSH